MDELSEPSGPEKSSSSSENVMRSSSPEILSISSSTENFIKPSRPKRVSRKSYRKRSLSKNNSESFVNDISEAKKRNVQSLPFPCEGKPLAKSSNKVDSKDNAFYDNVSDSDKMMYDNDGDGERETTIISD
ncbi:uncharacterized protein CXorf66 homolog [Desmodus rotundus]|uniref:uncharacterized protein CXorf66 homolog n=1 Tax=Desmodus rotundus TaxID=9430 RepID=UPI000D18211D|nr:uncharacterized protein CXorf66 homolog [Desmodus rotundus]